MPFDGSGNFNRVMNWVADAAASIKIKADRHDAEDDNLAAGLSNTITKDGQSQPTANIPFNGKRITNVANPVNPQDAMTLAQMMASNVRYDVAQALTIAQQLQAHVNLADTASVAVKSGTYALLQSDRRKLLRITGATTITLPAAATVGNDFSVDFRTMGGILTLDPAGTEQIEGANVDYPVADGSSGTLWCDGTGWWVTVAGAIKTVLVATSQTWTKPVGCKAYRLRGAAGGGGGGCATTTSADQGAGGGGGSGGYGETDWIDARTVVSATVVIGAAGQGATTAGNNGGTGGTTTWNDGTNSFSWTGGGGGSGANGIASSILRPGGIGGFFTGAQLFSTSNSGNYGWSASTGVIGGDGGSSPFGRGGFRVGATSHGTNAFGYGAGGGGGARQTASTGTSTGGDGTLGGIFVDMRF